MRKYSTAPKDVAEALRESVPVSKAAALGADWKKLPLTTGSRSKTAKKGSNPSAKAMNYSSKKSITDTSIKKKSATGAEIRIKTDTVEVTFGGVRFKAQGTRSASYGKGLAKVVKDYIKAHPVKA
jgi:hypothetical protein